LPPLPVTNRKKTDEPYALAIVMRLAVQPAHAADALGLLHELEVQQIELQMQIDELQLARLDRPAG
jgi:hypothetical protein